MIKHPDQRVGVFIDTQNMYHSARSIFNSHVSFRNIVETAVAGRHLIRAIAYVVRTPGGEEQPFFDALVKSGIEARVKDLQEFSSGAKKADWDVGIAVDAIRIAELLDTVIIVSGDGDFIPLVEYLKNRGRQVEVVAFRESASSKLVEVADNFLNLSDDPRTFLIRGGAAGAPSAKSRNKATEPETEGDNTDSSAPTTRRTKRVFAD